MQWFPIWQQFLFVCAMVCSLFYLTLRFTKYPCAMQWSLEFLCLFTIFCDVVHRLPLRDAVILMAETNKIFVSTLAFFFYLHHTPHFHHIIILNLLLHINYKNNCFYLFGPSPFSGYGMSFFLPPADRSGCASYSNL